MSILILVITAAPIVYIVARRKIREPKKDNALMITEYKLILKR